MIGHDVENVAQPGLAERGGEPLVPLFAAQLRVEGPVIDDVVAVHRARGGLQDRAGVEVGDPQLGEVGEHPGRGVERKALVQLDPVGGDRLPGCRKLTRHLVEQTSGLLPADLALQPHSASGSRGAEGSSPTACARTAPQDVQARMQLPPTLARKTARRPSRGDERSSCGYRRSPECSCGRASPARPSRASAGRRSRRRRPARARPISSLA